MMNRAFQKNVNLLAALIRMHFKLNDYRYFLGFLWSFVGPLMTFGALYYIFRGSFGKDIPHFGLKLITGIFTLNFFISIVQITMVGVFQIRDLALNNRAPHAILLGAPLCIPLTKFVVELLLCVSAAGMTGAFTWHGLPQLLLLTCFFTAFSFGSGLCLGILNAQAGDIGEIWQRITPLFYFITPIFYRINPTGDNAERMITTWNPLTPFVLGFQQAVTGTAAAGLEPRMVLLIVFYSLSLLILGSLFYKKMRYCILEK